MNSAEYVAQLIAGQKASGVDLQEVAWNAALACVGWAYVFGARGEYCTPANRRAYYKDGSHPTIKTACKNFDGTGKCAGCKWFPNEKKTRVFDCRGFTYWILLQVYGWKLMGAGATSQWNNEDNWSAKGTVESMPKDTLVCLFVRKGKTMEHTGFGFNDMTVECSNGVQYFEQRKKKWTDWGVPKCVASEVTGIGEPAVHVPDPAPVQTSTKATIRQGSKGADVAELQTALRALGYGLGPCGIDGDYGRATKAAVEQFQLEHGLGVDGICGPKTWAAVEKAVAAKDEPKPAVYTVTIRGVDIETARKISEAYPAAEVVEGGAGA